MALSRRQKTHTLNIAFTIFACAAAVLFLMPTVLTIANSFMTSSEISANYGTMFGNMTDDTKVFISDNVNLKFIPDKVTFDQYKAVLLKSPDYLLKFWNSVILTVPITLFQLIIAIFASYGFSRYNGKIKSIIFFAYVILVGDNPSRSIRSIQYIPADKGNEANPRILHRSRKAGRRQRIPDTCQDTHTSLQERYRFGSHAGIHRLLEHGGTAAGTLTG